MNSGEVARLAGVTVRTLRHYHQIGVLPEPPRAANGYRRYRAADLVRLLRIKRLATLGIPLDRMPDLLDGTDQRPPELLDQLDRELAAEIERLTRQREVIAQIRAEGVAPDIPPELGRFFAVFGAAGVSPEMTAADRDQSILLAHLVGEQAMPHLVEFYELLASDEYVPRVTAFALRFAELGPQSRADEVDALVAEFVEIFGPAVSAISGSNTLPAIDEKRAGLLDDLRDDQLNDAQRAYLARVQAYFT
ncbi:MerR family transcriptional regulator [Polymorphospora rubra]|uniref:MerR family transcriptional regulator n=1 Tax=Polymorphospora rubra TaxID=338584 RepID=A0A810N082_9ACTN|nr:MerR family transcriptional regulator [Polymorphospora rubra]BCJ66084.1 MerR family transcriptional regulator [Polymorphospora rubra]